MRKRNCVLLSLICNKYQEDSNVGTAADLDRAVLGGDLLMGDVVLPLLLQLVCHADQEVCAEVVHAHIAPSIPQLPCAWKHCHTLVNILCNTRLGKGPLLNLVKVDTSVLLHLQAWQTRCEPATWFYRTMQTCGRGSPKILSMHQVTVKPCQDNQQPM